VFILEQTMRGCGIREELVWHLHAMGSGCRVDGADLGEKFATHGSIKDLYAHYGLNAQRVADYITEVLGYEN
jgi:deoxyxylulose-5-phosphate synthase